MPSHLRLESSFEEPISANATYRSSPTPRPVKKQKMSLTQTYYVASTARSKLAREANQADHNLRRLVAHANTLDALMVELQDAEREQEQWFNTAVRKASKPEEPRRVQWMDKIAEEYDDQDETDSESEDGSEIDDEEEYIIPPPRAIRTAPVHFSSSEPEMEEDDYEEGLTLRRSPSRSPPSPPELDFEEDDSESESEDDLPAPVTVALQLSEKQRQAISTTSFYQDFAIDQRQQPLIAAC